MIAGCFTAIGNRRTFSESYWRISGLREVPYGLGTVSYAAPEQPMDQPMDGRADLYALAATTHHLLTGSPPFDHSNPAAVISHT